MQHTSTGIVIDYLIDKEQKSNTYIYRCMYVLNRNLDKTKRSKNKNSKYHMIHIN